MNIGEDRCDGGIHVSVDQPDDGPEEITVGLELFYGEDVIRYEAGGTKHGMGPFTTEVRRRLDRETPAPLFGQVDAAVAYDDVEAGFNEELGHAYGLALEEGRLRHGARGPFWYGTLERGDGDTGIGDLLALIEDETGINAQHYYDKCRAKRGL